MQGMQPYNEAANNTRGSVEIRKKPTGNKAQVSEPRVRIQSAGGRRKVFKRSPSSASAMTRPNMSSHHVSFGDDLVTEVDHDSDETISELRDKLTNLRTNDPLPVSPSKSILKNRRRSIDDLDVGTKRGLAMYLKSKHRMHRKHNGPLH